MELKKIFAEYASSTSDICAKSHFLISGWEDFEGVVWPGKKIDILLSSIVEKINLKKQDIVIEVGCGSGFLSGEIAKYCQKIYSIDISLEMLKKALIINPKLEVILGDGANLPFEENYFDKIICYFVFINIIDDQYILRMIREAIRVVKKGGIVLFGHMPDESKSVEYDAAKVKYKNFLLAKYIKLRIPVRQRVPIKLFNREKFNQMLSSIQGIEYDFSDSFNAYWMEGEPEQIDYRFDVAIRKG